MTCAHLHHNWFIPMQNTVFTSWKQRERHKKRKYNKTDERKKSELSTNEFQ